MSKLCERQDAAPIFITPQRQRGVRGSQVVLIKSQQSAVQPLPVAEMVPREWTSLHSQVFEGIDKSTPTPIGNPRESFVTVFPECVPGPVRNRSIMAQEKNPFNRSPVDIASPLTRNVLNPVVHHTPHTPSTVLHPPSPTKRNPSSPSHR